MFNGLSAIRMEDLFERVVVSRAQGHSLKLKKTWLSLGSAQILLF
jgi:hypothetical protein